MPTAPKGPGPDPAEVSGWQLWVEALSLFLHGLSWVSLYSSVSGRGYQDLPHQAGKGIRLPKVRNLSSNFKGHTRWPQRAEGMVLDMSLDSRSDSLHLLPICHVVLVSRVLVFSEAEWGSRNVRTDLVWVSRAGITSSPGSMFCLTNLR